MSINRMVSLVSISLVLAACASTTESSVASTSDVDERNRMVAQMEQDRAERQEASAAHGQREAALERQSEAERAQNRTPQQR